MGNSFKYCLAVSCKHHNGVDCSLKEIVISKEGSCSDYISQADVDDFWKSKGY